MISIYQHLGQDVEKANENEATIAAAAPQRLMSVRTEQAMVSAIPIIARSTELTRNGKALASTQNHGNQHPEWGRVLQSDGQGHGALLNCQVVKVV